ncbi:hypothetical protein BV898_04170 [Hypsibius exemplaris]|uniref:Uncharacterized protein n=1 Tax=Hypsibius exemplaris TaxID=2072580 RepID=A0A1W0X384_HYPEX|nr:hypothetical protein BV898_04170 [Hypsibius exemplaris]
MFYSRTLMMAFRMRTKIPSPDQALNGPRNFERLWMPSAAMLLTIAGVGLSTFSVHQMSATCCPPSFALTKRVTE